MLWSLIAALLSCHLSAAFTPPLRGTSRIFLDTADTKAWDELLPTGLFHGVTTDPTLLQLAGEPCTVENLHRMASLALTSNNCICNEFMCQAWGESAQDMYQCGMALSQPDRHHIVIKVPVTREGVEAASLLVQNGCRVCLTACYNQKQAFLAASVGAEYIAPCLGRMDDMGTLDGTAECLKMQAVVKGMASQTRILVAGIQQASTMIDLAAQGMETFAFSPQVARELFVEPLTTEAAWEIQRAATEPQLDDDEVINSRQQQQQPQQLTAEDFGPLPDECELGYEEDGSISILCDDAYVAESATVSD